MRVRVSVIVVPLLSLALASCRGDARAPLGGVGGDDGGTVIIATGADADYLLPPFCGNNVSLAACDAVFERLADPSDELGTIGDTGFHGVLARSWSWAPDSLSIAFFLDPRAHWHDGVPVRAQDVAFTYHLNMDPAAASPNAPLLANIDSVTVRDSLTAVFWFKHRSLEQFYDATYQMKIIPQHVYGAIPAGQLRQSPQARQPVGSGRFRFVRWVPNSLLELIADTSNYHGRARLDRVIWSVTPDIAASGVKLLSGDADLLEFVPPPMAAEIAKHPELTVAPRPSMEVIFLTFNLTDPAHAGAPHPIFGDRDVRRALSKAVDRPRLVENVLGPFGRVALGPLPRAVMRDDTLFPQPKFDLDSAKLLLDQHGWRDPNHTGLRQKNGRPLRFTIGVPGSSRLRQQMAVLLQAAFKEVGAQVEIEQSDMNALIDNLRRHHFDAAIASWSTDPTPSTLRQTWVGREARLPQSDNYGGYDSPRFDAQLDSAVNARDASSARREYGHAYATIVADVPAIFLYEPAMRMGVHRRIQPAPLRADAWWAHLADWTVPPPMRIARDSAGIVTAAR